MDLLLIAALVAFAVGAVGNAVQRDWFDVVGFVGGVLVTLSLLGLVK